VLRTRQFGNYEIIRKLARGMTDVYLAFDTRANRHAVLKIVEESNDPLTQLILQAERRGAAIQKQLHDADSRVIEIYDSGELDGYFFIAMQYVEGQTVAEILKAEKRIEPKRAAKFAREILSQLDKLHSFQADIGGERRSVVHGDIKPSNIQIGANDEVRLLDFGIAKVLTFTHSRTHLNLGSPSYCSPERLIRGQVDRHVDLWAVGVTLYEMAAGSPPYQAQDTRKLEELIQSRRPPRALPAECPSAMAAILNKALAGDLHQRYVSAAAFESDLRLYVRNQPTVAETERRTSWNVNPTVERPRPRRIPERAANMAATVKQGAMAIPKRTRQIVSVMSILVALCWGLLAGFIVCVPLGYFYRFQRESGALRDSSDYLRRSIAEINAEWDVFQHLKRQNAFLGDFSPVSRLTPVLKAKLLATADEIVDRYRNSTDPAIQDFDWQKAAACLRHAHELSPADRAIHGKLELAAGYVNLLRSPPLVDAAAANFEQAASLNARWPDPHLALARVYIYSRNNIGKAVAELHEAQRLGFTSGPREAEQQADGYRLRAMGELEQARANRQSRTVATRYLRLAERDFGRARELYEQIAGFSNASAGLRQVDDDDRSRQELDAALKQAARRQHRPVAWRARRWQ
jgi:hypothetical protein